MSIILIVFMVSHVFTYVKSYEIVHFKCVQFITCQLYLIKNGYRGKESRRPIKQMGLFPGKAENPHCGWRLGSYLCTNLYNCMILLISVTSWVIGTENVKSSKDKVSYYARITATNRWKDLNPSDEASFLRCIHQCTRTEEITH